MFIDFLDRKNHPSGGFFFMNFINYINSPGPQFNSDFFAGSHCVSGSRSHPSDKHHETPCPLPIGDAVHSRLQL